MKLNEFAAKLRTELFESLQKGLRPEQGTLDDTVYRQALATGRQPQMGSTRYTPDAIHCEFIYPDAQGSPVVLTISTMAPERIVFMPVPQWVVESIWQGEISGSPHFESEAYRLLEEFRALLGPEENVAAFEARTKVAREA